MANCICPSCQTAGYNTHELDMHQSARFNPTVRADQIEEPRVSERAETIADSRREDTFSHTHVSVAKLLNGDRY
jgi:hypothetical protein